MVLVRTFIWIKKIGEVGQKSKVLITKKAIMEHLGINADTFSYWIENGMPAVVENRRWYAHTDNLDEFFKVRTRRRAEPDEIAE